jgi:RimJ/RimL family protein N-acetyltransferase
VEVYLRPLAASDVPVFASWGLDRVFCDHAGWTVDLPLAAHEEHWRKLLAQQELLRLAAVADTEVVGYADLAGQEPDRRELGYAIGPSARWGQGLGGIVARLAIEHGFQKLGLQEIWAEAVDANQPSIRILKSLGMTETGRGDDEPFLGAPSFYRRFSLMNRRSP